MKQLIKNLYWTSHYELTAMKKSEMRLSERLKYERALIRLDTMMKLIEQYFPNN